MNSSVEPVNCGIRRAASKLVLLAVMVALGIVAAALAPAGALAAPAPSVSSVSPAGGPPAGGTSVQIRGARLTGASEVRFGATEASSFTVVGAGRITASAPAGAGTVDVTVTTPNGVNATSAGDQFTYGPSVTGVSPGRGPASGGTSVTITGSDLSAATAVEFGSTAATSFEIDSQGSITAVSPPGTGTVDVTVIDPEATSAASTADRFTYVPAPTVTGLSPAGGPEAGGTVVTITGTNLEEVTAVDFGLTPAGFFFLNNEGSITASSPVGAGIVDVTLTGFGGVSATAPADRFSYEPAPMVTGVSPESGLATGGETVTITGANLAGASAVDFGSVAATEVVTDSPSSITAVVPPGTAGATVDVTVTTLGGTSPTTAADHFRYLQSAPLVVTKVMPVAGAMSGGTLVTIIGNAFVGATAVDFGATPATSFSVIGEHKLKALAPPGTGTVDVTVLTPEGVSAASEADRFSSVGAPPTVEAISPAEVHEQGKRRVTIRGANLAGATEVHFGSAPATSFVVNGKGTEIVAGAPPATDEAVVDVTVTTPEGTSATSPADRLTYVLDLPIVTSISPNKGPAGGGTSVSIGGSNFIEVTSVTFGSVPATSFTVNSTGSITAISPASTVGKADVFVTTPAGTSESEQCQEIPGEEGPEEVCAVRDEFRYLDPTITGVTPNSGPAGGGNAVTVSGTGFAPGTSATTFVFGSRPAASVDCASSTTCTVIAPVHGRGTVDVKATITTTDVITKTTHRNRPADQYTYE